MKYMFVATYLAILSVGLFSLGYSAAEPESECVLCIGHGGTCGCNLRSVVCCDGEPAYACSCR